MEASIATRRASAGDVDSILAHLQAGFDSYVEFAPIGWQPPQLAADRERTLARLDDPQTWALLAIVDRAPVGHVAFFPARERAAGDPPANPWSRPLIAGMVHLWQLFVLPEWWGRGVAGHLHELAVEQMRAQGYAAARLFTPSLHARARRFYERRGWYATGDDFNEDLGLMVTEYRLALD